MIRTDYVLNQTCHAFPEAYEVILDGVEIGYAHLRWGVLRVTYGDETLIEIEPDELGFGEFDPEFRNHYLNLAVAAIDERHHGDPPPKPVVVSNADPIGWTRKTLD